MAFTLKPLPFARDSLGPVMSARTVEHHHDKHHANYVRKLNELTGGTPREDRDLETLIRDTANRDGLDRNIFNNAAQTWNHDFFWESIAPNGGGTPPESVLKGIERDFSSLENFRDRFIDAAVGQFGSGWAWLIAKDGRLEIATTHDADNPLISGNHAVWTCDVWEHAYYLDYQQERARFVKAVIENLANWQFVSKRLVESGQ
ncbi:superoxide dismutase [Povalibacter sp.]|uniref:superoxide dismutase n=1 Tax=Povalibacter sp. TaxID=1962978 RepID=UPI0032C24671